MEEKVASSALAPSPDAPSEAVGASLNVSDDKAESKEERLEEINFVKDPKLDLLEIIKKLESSDMRVGWVERRPNYSKVVHGWFFESHVDVLQLLLDKENTSNFVLLHTAALDMILTHCNAAECIIELGSWLGRSAEYFARNAPNAVIFAIDIWDNSVILADKHYCNNPENMAILNVGPLHERFMSNMWEYKYQVKDGKVKGMLPMHMDAVEGLRILKDAGVEPDVVYVDASHHFDGVYRDIGMTLDLFPGAHIVGDDYDYPDVRRAVQQLARERNLDVFESGNKCWTFSRDLCLQQRKKRKLKEEELEKSTVRSVQRPRIEGKQSLKDLLNQYKKK